MPVTVVAPNITLAVAQIKSAFPDLINHVDLKGPNAAHLKLAEALDLSTAKAQLTALAPQHGFDVFFYSETPQLVVFDMDSTLIRNECIDLIAKRAGVEAQVAEITERAMRGELDFAQSLAERVGLLKGIDSTTIYRDLVAEIEITPGARELCAALRASNVKMAVLSGGFQPIVDWIKAELGLDYAFANHLVADETTKLLTGTTEGAIVDGARKATILRELAAKHNIPLSQAVAVGDGSNDLPMMAAAGYGIAWHAKPIVRAQAPSQLNSASLADILYVLGLK